MGLHLLLKHASDGLSHECTEKALEYQFSATQNFLRTRPALRRSKHLCQKLPSEGLRNLCNFFRSSRRYNATATGSSFGSEINNPICRFNDVKIVFDDDNCIALINQTIDDVEQLADVLKVQPGSRFIKDVDRTPSGAFLQLRS